MKILVYFIASCYEVWAEGGIDYKVKVKERCGKDWKITLHYGVGGNRTKSETLHANSSVTFETGARCPYSLSGDDPYHVYAIYSICADGNTSGCSVSCGSSDWEIVKTGSITNTSDGQISFKFNKD